MRALPAILHHIHPLLPGPSDADTPCGLSGRRFWDDAPYLKALFPQIARLEPPRRYAFRALYAMGSPGSVFFTSASDLDLWLLADDGALDAYDLERARTRLAAIEKWAAGEGLEIHIFLHRIGSIRDNSFKEDSENAGEFASTLKEEFYRSALLLAGDPPTFWEGGSPDAIDLGEIPHLSPDAYLGAALHFLEKALERPFKTALKAYLIRNYAERGEAAWVATRLRSEVLAGKSPDPYLLSLKILHEFLTEKNEIETFLRIKEALYLKLILEESTEARRRWARERLVAAGFLSIGPPIDLDRLDSFPTQPLEERWGFVERLSKLLERGMREAIAGAKGVRLPAARLRVLARRFELHLAPPPPRIPIHRGGDLPTPGEPIVTFFADKDCFALVLDRVLPNQGVRPEKVHRRAETLWELFAYGVANQIVSPERTETHIQPRDAGPKRLHDILAALRDFFARVRPPRGDDLLAPARPTRHLLLIGKPKATEVSWLEADSWGTVSFRFFTGREPLAEAAAGILEGRSAAPVDLFSDSPPAFDLSSFGIFLETSRRDPPEHLRGFAEGKSLWLAGRGGISRAASSRDVFAFLAKRGGPFETYHAPEGNGPSSLPGEILSRATRGEVTLFLHEEEALVLDEARRAFLLPWPAHEEAHLLRHFAAFIRRGLTDEDRSWVRLRLFRMAGRGRDGGFHFIPEDPGPDRAENEFLSVLPHEGGGISLCLFGELLPPVGNLFHDAARRIREIRGDRNFYPVFVTAVSLPEAMRGRATLVDYLRLKGQIEERLTRELRAFYPA